MLQQAKVKSSLYLKKGVSPVIATLLLTAMVIIIGMIVFLWIRGWQEESITKFEKNVEIVCEDIKFSVYYDSDKLDIVNDGNVNVFDMNVEISKLGSYETKSLREDFDGWPEVGLNSGRAVSITMILDADSTKINVIPILAGKSESGTKSFDCGERYGMEIEL